MSSPDVNWKNLWWVIAIPIVCWMAAIVFYVCQFSTNLSNDQAIWGQLGDYVGGLINPVISLVGLIAVIITLRANADAINETRKQLCSQMFAESENHFVELEKIFEHVPSALKFHGVDPKELDEADISPAEFSYLMANFTAGGINVRAIQDPDESAFAVGDYYYTMLTAPKTRKAWPILTRLMAPSPYKKRIEATIKAIEEFEGKSVGSIPPKAVFKCQGGEPNGKSQYLRLFSVGSFVGIVVFFGLMKAKKRSFH